MPSDAPAPLNGFATRDNHLVYQSFSTSNSITINIAVQQSDGSRWGQVMEGFGASLTHSSAYLLHSMPLENREKVLKDLFDPTVGIGLSYLRIPMGTSDFRLEDYTYADLPWFKTVWEQRSPFKDRNLDTLDFFSIERDRAYLIPIIKQILHINPAVQIMASPWSAPDWMKIPTNGYLRPEMYGVYALYFLKFLQEYAIEGIDVHAITLQNEPDFQPIGYKGMRMSADDQGRLAIVLGRLFRNNNVETKIIIWDHNWDNIQHPLRVLRNAEVRPYVDGVAFHGYAGRVEQQTELHNQFPETSIYFTECGGTAGTDFSQDLSWDMENLIIGATNHWAKTVLKWNLALNEQCGPKIRGGHENARGVVTISSDNSNPWYIRNVEYYALGHASKFVKPGAKRILSTGNSEINYVAFANLEQEESIVIIAYNGMEYPKQITVTLNIWNENRNHAFEIPARSVSTLVFKSEQYIPTVVTTNAGQSTLLGQPAAPPLIPVSLRPA